MQFFLGAKALGLIRLGEEDTNERANNVTNDGRKRTANRQAVLSRCASTWVSSVGGEGCEQVEDERKAN